MEKKLLHVYPQRCTACRNCEIACSFAHPIDGKAGVARIKAFGDKEGRVGHNQIVVCMQCEDAACVSACPANALWRNPDTGAIYLLEERCIRCHSCVAACPFGNMRPQADEFPSKCDVCGGDPACVKFCPANALEYK